MLDLDLQLPTHVRVVVDLASPAALVQGTALLVAAAVNWPARARLVCLACCAGHDAGSCAS